MFSLPEGWLLLLVVHSTFVWESEPVRPKGGGIGACCCLVYHP